MPKLSRSFANSGSLKKSDGKYVPASAMWDKKAGGFLISRPGQKKLGPYVALHEAKAAGVEFHADGGRRAA